MKKATLILLILVPFFAKATDGGIQVSDNPPGAKGQFFPQVVATGDGGCIIAWEDNRNGRFGIRAQKLYSSGQRQWTSGDVYVTSDFTEGHITSLSMCADDDGGAYIAFAYWHDTDSKDAGVYIQHVTDSGQLWSTSVNLYPIDGYEDRWEFKGFPGRIIDICTNPDDPSDDDDKVGCWVSTLFVKKGGDGKLYKGVRCYFVSPTGTWDVAYADSSSSYSYIAPSVCTYGDSVMLACGKGDLGATVFAAKIYPLLGSYNSSTYQLGSYPGDMCPTFDIGSGYGKCLDVDSSPVAPFLASSDVEQENSGLPTELSLTLEKHNLGNESCLIRFGNPSHQHLKLSLYDATGRQLLLVRDEILAPGWYEYTLDLSKQGLANGAYFIKLTTGTKSLTEKVLLVR